MASFKNTLLEPRIIFFENIVHYLLNIEAHNNIFSFSTPTWRQQPVSKPGQTFCGKKNITFEPKIFPPSTATFSEPEGLARARFGAFTHCKVAEIENMMAGSDVGNFWANSVLKNMTPTPLKALQQEYFWNWPYMNSLSNIDSKGVFALLISLATRIIRLQSVSCSFVLKSWNHAYIWQMICSLKEYAK